MPTENRSSNTELFSQAAAAIEDLLANGTGAIAAAAWASLPADLRKLTAQPAPQSHPEPIAWMVGTAFWWTKEEAERDAAETGLPLVGLGPMTCAAPAEQRQGEPVALPAKLHPCKVIAAGWNQCLDVIGRLGPLYTHADPGEVERLRADLASVKADRDAYAQNALDLRAQLAELKKGLESQVVEGLRADTKWLRDELDKALLQLAQRDALLQRMKNLFRTDDPFDLYDAVCDALAGKS